MQEQQQKISNNDQHNRFYVQKLLAGINRRGVIIGFVLGLFAYSIAPALFHTCTTLFSEFLFLIQQPQMANAWQSIGGIIDFLEKILVVSFAVYTFCQRRIKKKNSTANQIEKRESEQVKQSVKDDP